MNGEKNQPMNSEALSPFEKMLGGRALGPGPISPRDVMYECGYAAGVTATRKRMHLATTRWQICSLVAGSLACLFFSTQFFPSEEKLAERIAVENRNNAAHLQSAEEQPASIPSAWITHLTRDISSDQRTAGDLRATGAWMSSANNGGLSNEMEVIPFSDMKPSLRPSDFPLFL